MNFEPQKFFIGVTDFFSVLLPGALLAYLAKNWAANQLLGQSSFKLEGAEAWMVFLAASYLLGHFLFLIGSLLDDYVYDPIRESTKEQITPLSKGRTLVRSLYRRVAKVCFKLHPDAALDQVISIKEGYLRRIEAPGAINAFQWCKARLALEHPEALAIVNRYEADSKFFRSFVPVLVGLLVLDLYRVYCCIPFGPNGVGTGAGFDHSAAFGLLAVHGAALQSNATGVLASHHSGSQPSRKKLQIASLNVEKPHAGTSSDAVTHAGGVVFRQTSAGPEYLLVQATKNPSEWVLPKGHIEVGEDMQSCAIREVREETGVWGRIKKELKLVQYCFENHTVRVQFYLMEAEEQAKPKDRSRKHAWLRLGEALHWATHDETKDLLRMAAQKRNEP